MQVGTVSGERTRAAGVQHIGRKLCSEHHLGGPNGIPTAVLHCSAASERLRLADIRPRPQKVRRIVVQGTPDENVRSIDCSIVDYVQPAACTDCGKGGIHDVVRERRRAVDIDLFVIPGEAQLRTAATRGLEPWAGAAEEAQSLDTWTGRKPVLVRHVIGEN